MSDQGPDPIAAGGTLPPPPPPQGEPGKARNWKKIGLIAGSVFVALLIIGSLAPNKEEDGKVATTTATTTIGRSTTSAEALETSTTAKAVTTTSGTSSTSTSSTSTTAPPPTTIKACDLACHMTRDSEIHKIPLPDDAVPVPGGAADVAVSTEVGTMSEVGDFYIQWMGRHDWGFDQANSELDPSVSLAQSQGYFINMTYCRGEGTSVAIMVGPHPQGDQENGKNVEIWILDLPEEPCA